MKEKVKQVESLIAEAADIEELERLEAALQKKSVKELDVILKEYRMKQYNAMDAMETAVADAAEQPATTTDSAITSEDGTPHS